MILLNLKNLSTAKVIAGALVVVEVEAVFIRVHCGE